jgi:snurportin-1
MSSKRAYKVINIDQDKRRKEFLKHQKQRREDARNNHRNAATLAIEECDTEYYEPSDYHMDIGEDVQSVLSSASTNEVSKSKSNRRKRTVHNKSLLTVPEWMVEVPSDIMRYDDATHQYTSDWIIMARPEGKRCIVTSGKGITTSRLDNGHLLHTFKTILPGGGIQTQHSHSAILDCIYQEETSTYYILDLLEWNGMSYTLTTTEFRFYWLRSKIDEISLLQFDPYRNTSKYQFRIPPMYICNYQNLQLLYFNECMTI